MNVENLKHGLKILYRKRESTGSDTQARNHFNNEVIGYNKAMEAMLGHYEAGRIAHEAWIEFNEGTDPCN